MLLLTALPSQVAIAKGGSLTFAYIIGPGITDSVRLRGPGFPTSPGGWPFAYLMGALSPQGRSLSSSGAVRYSDPAPREGDLGPAYLVSYLEERLREQGKRTTVGPPVHQVLYPFALGGPMVYTPPGQAEGFFHTLAQRETSGWKRSPQELLDLLARNGFPSASPDERFQPARYPLGTVVAAAFALAEDMAEVVVGSLVGPKPLTPEPAPLPTPSLSWQRCAVGPWATHCPEAWWARNVSIRAGYAVVGDTGSAIEIRDSTHAFHLWAFEPEQPATRQKDLRRGNYHLFMQVNETPTYFDGLRFTWTAHNLHVWLNAGLAQQPDSSNKTITDEEVIAQIVRATLDLPFP